MPVVLKNVFFSLEQEFESCEFSFDGFPPMSTSRLIGLPEPSDFFLRSAKAP